MEMFRKGYGQVEPNHLSGIVEGRIYAQLPVDTETMGKTIEQGRFAKYDMVAGKVNLTGAGEWCMIYNEEKNYDERKQSHKDFAMVASRYTDEEIVPRLITTQVGDIFTTNCFGAYDAEADGIAEDDAITIVSDNDVTIDTNTGYLTIAAAGENYDGPVFKVVKEYTMPDGQPGVKLQRVK